MLTPAQHYARADELLEEAATVRSAASAGWTTDPRPSEELGTGAVRAWERRRNDRVGRLAEASRLVDAAQAHATLATVPHPIEVVLDGQLVEVLAALDDWATSTTLTPALPRPPAEVWVRATAEAKATVGRLLDHVREVLPR